MATNVAVEIPWLRDLKSSRRGAAADRLEASDRRTPRSATTTLLVLPNTRRRNATAAP